MSTENPSSDTDVEPVTLEDEVYDPIEAEILRKRLYNIAQEMGQVIIRTSGDPAVAETKDFSSFIATPDGEIASFSSYLTMHSAPARLAVQHIQETVDDENINDGDQFIVNDPHTANVSHPPDVGIIKPVYHEDDLVAWAWSEAHMLDMGGVEPGSFPCAVDEAVAEALRFPGIKIVDGGEVVDGVRKLVETNVRLPEKVFNSMRALIASNNRAEERITNTIDEFGLETYRRYLDINERLTAKAFRDRIGELPDGTYSVTETVEHDCLSNNLYDIHLDLTVDGDSVTVDLSDSAGQVQGSLNTSVGAAVGSAMTPMMLVLAPDIPVNEGMFDPVDVITPSGSIVNPDPSAATSVGHMETGLTVNRAVTRALSRAMPQADSEYVREHTMAPGSDAWPFAMYSGRNQRGEPDIYFGVSAVNGGGAQRVQDGTDARGTFVQLDTTIPDVEMLERDHGVLFLWRRLNRNSGGPGEHRGGQGVEFAYTLHDIQGGQLTTSSASTQSPTTGVAGGYPGSTNIPTVVHDPDVDAFFERGEIPERLAEMDGDHEELPAKKFKMTIGPRTVVALSASGGSGFGDPLARDPARVAADVRDGYITETHAETAYGVVLADGTVDTAATDQRRRTLRERRQSWSVPDPFDGPAGDTAAPVREFNHGLSVVAVDGDEYLRCRNCETVVAPLAGPDDTEWRTRVPRQVTPVHERMHEMDMDVQPRAATGRVMLDEHACPECGQMLYVGVHTEH